MKRIYFPMLLAGCRCLALLVLFNCAVWRVSAQASSLYENDAVTQNPVPTPDATNFVNNSYFTISVPSDSLYQTRDTVNYTNNGYMYSAFGFYFDDYSTGNGLNYEAGSFENENTIEGAEQVLVWATNVVDPGWTYVDDSLGLMQFTGNSVNLNNSTLQLENTVNIQGEEGLGLYGNSVLSSPGANVVSEDYGVGTDTKGEWIPSTNLTATAALSSLYRTLNSPNLVNYLQLINSTCYFDIANPATNEEIIRAVFVEDLNPTVTHNAYFGPSEVGSGVVTVGWSGVFTNIATGQATTNYLYLNDEPALISSNGVNIVQVDDGIPDNYTIQGSQTPIPTTSPATEGFDNVFPPGNVTNNYSYLEAQLISTTVSTNTLIATNISAIGGRVVVSAANELQLNQAVIGGENYMSLTATNQFDGNNGASIAAPYSDINLGVTNGNLVVSNLIQSALPIWSGTIQAWSTRWVTTTSNTVITPTSTNTYTVTNDFRVELVLDNIAPSSPAQVQNLTLTGTNSVQISDDFNIFGNFLINTRSLTLTTNGFGNGAESEFGELNFENDSIFWPSSLPNLLWLTNNGAINIGNLAMFGSAAPAYTTNITPAISAIGTLSEVSGKTNVLKGNKVLIGNVTYTFVTTVTNKDIDQVKIAPTFNGTMSNLIAAIDHSTVDGKGAYSTNTAANIWVSAGVLSNDDFVVTALVYGTNGNSVSTTTTSTNLLWSGLTLTGGFNGTTNITSVSGPYDAFVNSGTITDLGSQIYANYFANGGLFDNIFGPFTLTSTSVVLTNGEIFDYYPFAFSSTNEAGFSGDISISAANLVVSNLLMEAGGGLTLLITNSLDDMSVSNGNQWYLDGGASLQGLDLPLKPTNGSLLGTTINLFTPTPNKPVKNYWSALDSGVSASGYSNNVAIGQLILDVTSSGSSFYFSGPVGSTTNNAIYVDRLILENYASYANGAGSASIPTLSFNTNLVIYYADALASSTVNGGPLQDVSFELNGSNTNHLLWVPQYMGYFSTTNIVYPGGMTYAINVGLASSPWDSIGNGVPNYLNPYPLFEPSQVNFTFALTNVPPEMGLLTWDSIPSATNSILYTTNLMSQNWTVVTNFVSPSQILTPSTWPITNVLLEPLHMTTPHGYYRVSVSPNSAIVYP